MTFLNPILAAVGVACIAVPILIHILMRRRRKPIAWGAMKFLLAAYKQQRRRMRLEQWLLLASRCAIIALVALAIGKPVLGAWGAAGGLRARTLFALLDNSLTSQAMPGAGEEEFAGLKARAKELLSNLNAGRGDRAALITLAGPAKAEVMPASSDVSQVSQRVERVAARSSRADLEGAVRLVRQSLAEQAGDAGEGSSEAVVVVLSAFRAGSVDMARPLEALSTTSRTVRVIASPAATAGADNTTILRAQPLRPLLVTGERRDAAAPLPVKVDLRRTGPGVSGGGVTQVRAWAGFAGNAAAPADAQTVQVQWSPGQTEATAFLTLDARALSADDGGDPVLSVHIGADGLAGDNTIAAPLASVRTLRVALIAPQLSVGGAGGGDLQSFASQDWLALALAPNEAGPLRTGASGGVRVDLVDPARVGTDGAGVGPELSGASAVVVTQPHLVDARGWRAIARVSAMGALVMVVPPEGEQTHLWTDPMADALGLGWTTSREPLEYSGIAGAGGATVSSVASSAGEDDLLALMRPELVELVKPVRVHKALAIESRSAPTTGSTGADAVGWSTLLALADGTPLIAAGRSRPAAENNAGTPGGLVIMWLAPPAPSWTDLPAKPLMVPLIQELLRQGVGRSGTQRAVVAGMPISVGEGAVELASVADGALVRVGTDGTPVEALRDSGLWRVRSKDGRTASIVSVMHDSAGGDTGVQRADDVQRWLSGLASEVSVLSDGGEGGSEVVLAEGSHAPPVSLPLLIAAGVVALIEVLMARWFSHAGAAAGGRADAAPGGSTA